MNLILLRNADVYAPKALGRRDLLLGGGRILWIGSGLPALPDESGCEVIDLEGRRLIPGLIDGHVHVTGGGGEAGFRSRVPRLELSRFTGAGVTTVIGLLGTDDIARGTRDLLARVYALREEGLSAYAYCGGYHLPPATLTGCVRDDLVFVEPLIGVGEVALSDHRSSQPTFDELVRLASEAHVAGLLTGNAGIVHLHMGDGQRGLELVRRALDETELPRRVFQPTHVNRRRALFDEALELARSGSPIDLTAFPDGGSEEELGAAEALLLALDAGIDPALVTISSDAGGALPCFDDDGAVEYMGVGESGALLATLRELVEHGLPLERALPAFTSNPARQLRLAAKGRVAPGADADLVALDANHAPDFVIAGGRIHVREGTAVLRGNFEPAPGARPERRYRPDA
ncbi:MAG: beta-aspartyl-peptidase [Gammaproteobacteria bacterium]|nr:beta-aspartyl-peptidase [Gammaproteobacteria bacterium]